MITLQEYHSRVELRREGSVNIYPAGSRMLPDFRRFLDRHSENPEALLWNPPFLECVLQDQEGFFRLAWLEGEKMGGRAFLRKNDERRYYVCGRTYQLRGCTNTKYFSEPDIERYLLDHIDSKLEIMLKLQQKPPASRSGTH